MKIQMKIQKDSDNDYVMYVQGEEIFLNPRQDLSAFMQFMSVLTLLSAVMYKSWSLPGDETIGQWVWFDWSVWVSLGFLLLSLVIDKRAKFIAPYRFQNQVRWSLILLGAIQALWGLRQAYRLSPSGHSQFTITGSFFNPGPYGGYLAVALPCAVYMMMKPWWFANSKFHSFLHRCAAGIAGTLIIVALLASESRSAWMAALVSCPLVAYLTWWRWQNVDETGEETTPKEKKKALTVIGCFLLLLPTACLLMYHIRPASADGRILIWMNCLRAIAQRPWTGYGWGNFGGAYGEAQEAYFASGHAAEGADMLASAPDYAFNEYLGLAVRIGIPATLLIVTMLVRCLRRELRKENYEIFGSLLALMVFSLSSYPMFYPSFVITLGVLVLTSINRNRIHTWLSVMVVLCIVSAFRLKKDMQTEQACQKWQAAAVTYRAGGYLKAEDTYKELYPTLENRAGFLYEYGHCLHRQGKFEESNRILKEALPKSSDPMVLDIIGKNCQAMGQYGEAEHWYLRAANRVPGWIYPYCLLTKLYAEPGYLNPGKFYKMKEYVLEKKAKVDSPDVRNLKEEIRQLELPQDLLPQTGQPK